jgi:hypothetical protein
MIQCLVADLDESLASSGGRRGSGPTPSWARVGMAFSLLDGRITRPGRRRFFVRLEFTVREESDRSCGACTAGAVQLAEKLWHTDHPAASRLDAGRQRLITSKVPRTEFGSHLDLAPFREGPPPGRGVSTLRSRGWS